MVLKKSNSRLNTGATQNVTRGGFVDEASMIFEEKNCLVFYASGSLLDDEETNYRECVRMVSHYLDWAIPFTTYSHLRQFVPHAFGKSSAYSLNKGNRDRLIYRLHEMMKDVEFLSKVIETTHFDIHFSEIQENPFRFRQRRFKETKATDVLKEAQGKEKTQAEPKSTRKQTRHTRGVQRKLANRSRENHCEQETDDTPVSERNIVFEHYKPFAVDARSGQRSRHMWKSPKGRRFQGLTKRDRNFMIRDELKTAAGKSPSFYTNTVEDTQQDDDQLMTDLPCNIMDFVKDTQKVKRTKCKKKKTKDEHFLAETRHIFETNRLIRTAEAKRSRDPSTKNKLRGQKEKHSKRRDGKSQRKETTTSATEALTVFDLEANNQFDQDVIDFENSWVTVKLNHLPKNGMASGNSFPTCFAVPVDSDSNICVMGRKYGIEENFWQIRISYIKKEMQSVNTEVNRLLKQLVEERVNKEVDIQDVFGVIKELKNHDDSATAGVSDTKSGHDNESVWGSVVKMLPVTPKTCSMDEAATILHLQPNNDFPTPCDNSSFDLLDQMSGGHIFTKTSTNRSFEDLIKRDKDNDTSLEGSGTAAGKFQSYTPSVFMDEEEEHYPPTLGTYSLLDFVKGPLSNENAKNKKKKVRRENKAVFSGRPAINTTGECEVCFMSFNLYMTGDMAGVMLLPCHHVYCITCWRAHIFHTMRRGVFTIPCMRHGCKEIMNETTIASIIPWNFVFKWKQKLLERRLEESLYSSWCPNNTCDKVATCPQNQLKTQFGHPVKCDCSHEWCSSCQRHPHWPASCDQIETYNVLLARTVSLIRHNRPTVFQVDLKKCPKCRYPIEKNEGCPHMVCAMCMISFCWHCLRPMTDHRGSVYQCEANQSNYTTYQLKNKLAYSLPINYFEECINERKELQKLSLKDRPLSHLTPRRITFPKTLLYQHDYETALKMSTFLYLDCLNFLRRARTLTETFYVLFCFAEMNKTKANKRRLALFHTQLKRVIFVLERLDKRVIQTPFREILKAEKGSRDLLSIGNEMLVMLIKSAPSLQQLSKDSKTDWVDSIDMSSFLRYK